MKEMKLLERIQLDAIQRMSWAKARTTNLYIATKPLRKGHVIQAHRQKIPVERETVMVFADDAPLYNWGHPCRYLLYKAKSGELYDEVKARFPPYLVEPPETYKAFYQPVVFVRPEKWLIKRLMNWAELMGGRLRSYPAQGNRYAVLFSGASNYRHVNDLEFLYRTLIDVYDFSPDCIYVLNYDGTINYSGGPKPVGNWPGDNTTYRMPANPAAGTKSALENVLDDLKGRLTRHDFLFIHTNNHGGHTGAWTGYPPSTESYLCTYSGPDYTASDFAAKLAELPSFAQLMVMMEQCHSGGFNDPIIDNSPADETTVASACEEDRSSTAGDLIFDPFARDWIAAVTGTDPYGAALAFDPDINGARTRRPVLSLPWYISTKLKMYHGDGVISASEAFNYADTVKDPYDTPVYYETPAGCGDDMHLGRPELAFVLGKILDYLKIIEIPPEAILEKLPKVGPRLIHTYDEVVRRIGEIEKLVREMSRGP